MRTITIVTGARSDYGIYRPILRWIAEDPELRLEVMVTGMHLSPQFGLTVREIERDGFVIRDRIDSLLASDSPQGIGQSMGLGVLGFSQAFGRSLPEVLLLLGDRTEMLAAGVAALPFRIPVVHVHGGEVTEGAIDDSARHCLTKLAHQHCVTTEEFARRVVQLGERPENVHVTGAPGLDAIRGTPLLSPAEFEQRFGVALADRPLLVTFHPVTHEFDQVGRQTEELLRALSTVDAPILLTYPNSDTNGRIIIEQIEQFAATRPRTRAVQSLGSAAYFTLMRHARAMVGNSSSGLIEAASFELPVVNVGTRQRGRPQPRNVISSGYSATEIQEALACALDPAFRESLAGLQNPYGDGHASERIVAVLKSDRLTPAQTCKSFYDLPVSLGADSTTADAARCGRAA